MAGKPRKIARIATTIESATPAATARASNSGIDRRAMLRQRKSGKKKPIRPGLERIGEIAKGVGS
jgi:hypothetical protein